MTHTRSTIASTPAGGCSLSPSRNPINEDLSKQMKENFQKMKVASLQLQLVIATESLAAERSQKLDALEYLKTLEKDQDSLKEELERAQQKALTANKKVETLEDQNKMLQKLNIKLEDQFERANNANKNLEREKDMISKYSMTLEKLCLIYEAQIADAKNSRDDAVKQKGTALKDADIR
ncbi:unnamed protein product [Lactuca saligna]|uniref:Uncharacterized protein n=1 Tax=Lactuca saligna TaxID=75948 RepID=A0AA36EGI4_LACSI|nr:unnamed protein product [Lactuca saligna]